MNFGVVSTANIATKAVIPAIQDSEHEVVAIASRDASRATTTAEELDVARAYGSYGELLTDEAVEAVYNPLPNALHAEWTKKAADHGHHVLCEKPLAVDADEAREVKAHCEEQGVTLVEAFMYRYHPRTLRAACVAREHLDDVRSVTATFQFPMDDPDDVRLDPDLAGGCLMDVGCYAVDAARLFLGEPERAYATTADTFGAGVDTELTAILEYGDGVTAEISAGFTTSDVQRYRVEATNGWLEAPEAFVPRGDDGTELAYAVDGRRVTETFDPTDQYRLEVERFADYVESGEPPRTDGAAAVRNMAVIDALYESADAGRPVAVDRRE
ncbi:Gfo/Idh/MocA family protein [Halomicrococcus sp. SG-WS-1]|uniref:Gfo/Idh/MocA family protein n=1 Tax=Halomicrococcus sp. SG-WS-1 TaxID=3439057 RepID=UPI003F7AB71A